jgi:hypothetical protein
MSVSFLLKGSILAVILIVIVIGTIIFIERKWIYKNVFRSKKRHAVVGYSFLGRLGAIFSIYDYLAKPRYIPNYQTGEWVYAECHVG